ncbi:hypothetical protein BDF19DRAFT_487285 [Syncephalis fuscata]|nr:hypothetical protein BDF19DRAFT_487285 [Syncephalis fuscata]
MPRLPKNPPALTCLACKRKYACLTSLRAHCKQKHQVTFMRQKCGRKRRQLIDADPVTRQRHFSRVWFYRNRDKRNTARREKRLVERVVNLDSVPERTLVSDIKRLRERIVCSFELPRTPFHLWILGCVILGIDHNVDTNLAPIWFSDKPEVMASNCAFIRERMQNMLYYPDRPTHLKIDVYNFRILVHQYALRHPEFSSKFNRLNPISVSEVRQLKSISKQQMQSNK